MALRSKTPRNPPRREAHHAISRQPAAARRGHSRGRRHAGAGPTAPPDRADPKGKLGALVALLRRPEGAQIPDLMAASGWQAHSVRGAIAGSLKVKHGLTITSEKTEAGRVYRIVEVSGEAPEDEAGNAADEAQA